MVENEWQEFVARKSSLTADEIIAEEARLEDLQDKMKRRMLGSIRFIGELYKKNMMRSEVMYICVTELLKPQEKVGESGKSGGVRSLAKSGPFVFL